MTTAAALLLGCESSSAIKISDVTFDAAANEGLIILETSSRIQGLADSDWIDIQQFDPSAGTKLSVSRSGRFHLSGTGGQFIVAKVKAGFHLVHSYEGVDGFHCFDVDSYGVNVEPGEIVFMGTLDSLRMQEDLAASARGFYQRQPVAAESPARRDRIVFTLTQNFLPVDSVTMSREFYASADEMPFSQFAGAEHTYRVTRKLFLTSMQPPPITPPSQEGMAAAQDYLHAKRPDLTQPVKLASLVRVAPVLEEQTCASAKIEPVADL